MLPQLLPQFESRGLSTYYGTVSCGNCVKSACSVWCWVHVVRVGRFLLLLMSMMNCGHGMSMTMVLLLLLLMMMMMM